MPEKKDVGIALAIVTALFGLLTALLTAQNAPWWVPSIFGDNSKRTSPEDLSSPKTTTSVSNTPTPASIPTPKKTNEQVLQSGEANIQYFQKNVDPSIISSRLEALGIRLDISTSQLSGVPTNAIWFGSGVDIDTVKAVANKLIGAGVELKVIRQFNDSQGREHLIQVGGDGECINHPTLTVEEIKNIQNFPQQRAVINCQASS